MSATPSLAFVIVEDCRITVGEAAYQLGTSNDESVHGYLAGTLALVGVKKEGWTARDTWYYRRLSAPDERNWPKSGITTRLLRASMPSV